MQIRLNGKLHACAEGTTLADLITTLQLTGKRIAVELNGEIAPRSRHPDIVLAANDHVEIVHAIGGG